MNKSLPMFQDISQCYATQATIWHPETSVDDGHQEQESKEHISPVVCKELWLCNTLSFIPSIMVGTDEQLQALLGTFILHPFFLALFAISSLLQRSLLHPPSILQLFVMVQQQCKGSPTQQSCNITSMIFVRKGRKIIIHHCQIIAKMMSFIRYKCCQTKMRCLIVLGDHNTISGIHYITYLTITSVLSNL